MWRINELLNWQVAASGETIDVADAAATKVFGTERIQYAGRLAEEIVGKYGNPADAGHRRTAGVAGQPDQAQSGDHVRRRCERGDARDDRGIGAEGAEGAAVSAVDDIKAAAERVKAEGKSKPRAARHPVNQPMVDHWLDAMGDKNPIYVDEAAAKAAGHPGIVAPPAMIQVWTMMGLGGGRARTTIR